MTLMILGHSYMSETTTIDDIRRLGTVSYNQAMPCIKALSKNNEPHLCADRTILQNKAFLTVLRDPKPNLARPACFLALIPPSNVTHNHN